jgi:hypothetical protein
MGVHEDYRNRGIDLAMYYHLYKRGVPKGYFGAEMSWVEEENVIHDQHRDQARRQALPQIQDVRALAKIIHAFKRSGPREAYVL